VHSSSQREATWWSQYAGWNLAYMARRLAPISASSYSAVVRQLSYAPSAQRPSLLVVLEHEKSDDQCLDVATSLTNQDSANGSHFSADCGDKLGVSNQPEIQKLAFHRRPPVSRLSMRICLHPSGQCGVSSLSNWSWAPRLAWSWWFGLAVTSTMRMLRADGRGAP